MKIKKFNEYAVKIGYVEIFVIQRDGKKHIVTVDEEDFNKIFDLGCSIHVQYHKSAKSFYPHITIYEGNYKYKNIKLTTFLFGVMKDVKIDHINNDTLNTRRSNLRLTNQANNLKNRKSKNSNNTSGYRNVTWIQGYWRIQLQINGKNHMFSEKFDDVDKAGKFAEDMRQKYYGEFAGRT